MRRRIELVAYAVLVNLCIGCGESQSSHPATAPQGRSASGDGVKPQPSNDVKPARKAVASQLIAAALREAQRLTDADERRIAYCRIAQAQARAGDVAGTRRSIETIKAALREVQGQSTGGTTDYCEIAEVQILTGDLAAARQTLETAKAMAPHDELGYPAQAYEMLLPVQLHLGDRAGARESVEAAKRIARDAQGPDAYCTVAEMQMELGDEQAARQSVEAAKAIAAKTQIENYDPRPYIARLQAKLGDVAEAKAALARIGHDDVGTTNAYEVIAATQAQKKDFAGAKATIAQIPQEAAANRGTALAKIAFAEAKAGDIAAAKATVENIRDDRLKAIAYRVIGGIQVESGDLAGAKATAEQIRGRSSIARQATGPIAIESQCVYESFAAMLYCQIAEAQANAEDRSLAQNASRRCLQVATAAAEDLKRKPNASLNMGWANFQIAAAQAMVGDATNAIQTTIAGEEKPLFRCQELAWIVEELFVTHCQESVLLFVAGVL